MPDITKVPYSHHWEINFPANLPSRLWFLFTIGLLTSCPLCSSRRERERGKKKDMYFRQFINRQRTRPSFQSHAVVRKYRLGYIEDQREPWRAITAPGRFQLREALRNVQGQFPPHVMIAEEEGDSGYELGGKNPLSRVAITKCHRSRWRGGEGEETIEFQKNEMKAGFPNKAIFVKGRKLEASGSPGKKMTGWGRRQDGVVQRVRAPRAAEVTVLVQLHLPDECIFSESDRERSRPCAVLLLDRTQDCLWRFPLWACVLRWRFSGVMLFLKRYFAVGGGGEPVAPSGALCSATSCVNEARVLWRLED